MLSDLAVACSIVRLHFCAGIAQCARVSAPSETIDGSHRREGEKWIKPSVYDTFSPKKR